MGAFCFEREEDGTDLWVRKSSTKEQNEARQLTALREMGIPSENVYLDKQSGADFERVQYRRMLRRLGPGDTLIVKSIDRLGRNYTEILEQWRIITKNKRAAIVILDMPLLDTRQNRDLTGQLIADIVLQLLSYVAETERKFIRQRQAEGISAARERGVRFGRDPAEIPLVYREWRAKKLGSRAAAERLGVSQTTFLKWAKAENLPKK